MENMKKIKNQTIVKKKQETVLQKEDNGGAADLLLAMGKLTAVNKSLYTQIAKQNLSFSHQLFRPQRTHGLTWQTQKQIKLVQLDELFEQREQLAKQKQYTKLHKLFEQLDQFQTTLNNGSQIRYGDLKNILSPLGNQKLDCMERIQLLSKVVKEIKGKVQIQTNNEKIAFRKSKYQGEEACWVPSKKFWKMEHQIFQLKAQLKNIFKENNKLHEIIKLKQQQLLSANNTIIGLKLQLQKYEKKNKTIQINETIQQNNKQRRQTEETRVEDDDFRFQQIKVNVNEFLQQYDKIQKKCDIGQAEVPIKLKNQPVQMVRKFQYLNLAKRKHPKHKNLQVGGADGRNFQSVCQANDPENSSTASIGSCIESQNVPEFHMPSLKFIRKKDTKKGSQPFSAGYLTFNINKI